MTAHERSQLQNLSKVLRKEQATLLLEAARHNALPSNSTVQRVAYLELNIAAIENTLADPVI